MANRKPKTCNECGAAMVSCDSRGNPVHGGGYWVCPGALVECSPKQFDRPWQKRTHREARVEEDHRHARQRRAAAKKQQLFMLDADAGMRAVVE